MRLHTLMVLTVGLLVAADAPTKDAANKELKKLQGAWRVVSFEQASKPEAKPDNMIATITGGTFTTKSGEEVVREGTLKLNPAHKPKAIDATYTAGPDKGKTLQGIYVLDGDTWKICYSSPGMERPREFPNQPGTAYLFLVLKKEKP